MNLKVRVKRFQASDYVLVAKLWKRAGLRVRRGDDKESILRKMKRDPELFLVASRNGVMIGTVIGGWDGRRGWIYHLAVDPKQQRIGVGKFLVRELENRMRRKKVPKVNALVYNANRVSLSFFRKMGYGEERGLTMVSKILS